MRLAPAVGAAVAKTPEEGRTGDVVAAVHDDKKILAQNRVALEAEFAPAERLWENQAVIEAVRRTPRARMTLSVVPSSGLPVSLSAR